MKKAITDIRGQDTKELQAKLNELRKEQWQLRFRGADEGAAMTTKNRDIRRTIARILTVIGERPFGASEDAGFLLEQVQSHGGEAAYLVLGANLTAPHHHACFDFDEAVLERGVSLLERWAQARLRS